MVLAIFNPFCCCTAAVFAVDDSEASPMGHSCCQSKAPEAPVSGCSDEGHDPSECPHQAIKDYQASMEKDTTATHTVASFLPALFAVIEFMVAEPVAQSQHAVTFATASQASPISVSQEYCVYRI